MHDRAYRNLKGTYEQSEMLPPVKRELTRNKPIVGLSEQAAAAIHLRAAALAAEENNFTKPGPIFDPQGLIAPNHIKGPSPVRNAQA